MNFFLLIFTSFLSLFLFIKKPTAVASSLPIDSPVTKKVLIINYNPVIESAGGKRLHEVRNWNSPRTLTDQYINDIREVSSGYANYVVTEWKDVNSFTPLQDGFVYSYESYLSCLQNINNCHNPRTLNYLKVINDFDLCGKRNRGEIDEVWLWGGPWFGYWEAVMTGPNSFSTNAVPIAGTSCQKQLHIMGFNYERGIPEMLEDLAHRVEGTMTHLFGSWNAVTPAHDWDSFTLTDHYNPGKAACGGIHYAPNSDRDYDWANTRYVSSNCNDWLNYPSLTGIRRLLNCETWQCSDYGYKKWWLSHLPRVIGITNNRWNNWWKYVLDYESALKLVDEGEFRFTVLKGANDFSLGCSTVIGKNEIYLGWDGSCSPPQKYKAKLIFDNVDILPKTNIKDAFWEFVADGPYSNPLTEEIVLQGGGVVTNPVVWQIEDNWTYQTIKIGPSLKNQMQQVVSGPAWQKGEQIEVVINHRDGASQRRFFAYEGDRITAARLVVITGSGTPIPTPAPLRGDLNNDGKVDNDDFLIFKADFGKTGAAGFIPADIDKNGKVDIFDYNILVGNYGL